MTLFIYSIFLALFAAGVRIAALFNPKAKKWVTGRRNIFRDLETAIGRQERIIWMHCASLGEFEQGRPLLEALKRQYPGHRLLLTFFSPSGYEIRKNYEGADWVFYLPADSRRNARRFLEIIRPSLVVFVKYEYWYYYLREIHSRKIPLLLVSALFRPNMPFFKWYGGLHRKMLGFFQHLFVQDERSRQLLQSLDAGLPCTVNGDTRFDRVIEIAEKATPVPSIETFVGGQPVIVAGSTWPEDEQLLQHIMSQIKNPSLRLIIAPHEIGTDHLAQIRKIFPAGIFYSELVNGKKAAEGENVLVIDNIGMLSRLYRHATITYIGGGFGKGIHNTLEAAVYGKPVLFGPAYQKFREAVELVGKGAAFPVRDVSQGTPVVKRLLYDAEFYAATCKAAGDYVFANRGATAAILSFIQEKRLLTS